MGDGYMSPQGNRSMSIPEALLQDTIDREPRPQAEAMNDGKIRYTNNDLLISTVDPSEQAPAHNAAIPLQAGSSESLIIELYSADRHLPLASDDNQAGLG